MSLIVGLSVLLAACSLGGSPPQATPASSTAPTAGSPTPTADGTADLDSLRGSLQAAGLQVGSWVREKALEPFFAGGPRRPWRLPVEDASVVAYPFASLASAKRCVAGINRKDPFPAIEFKGAPHVFRYGHIVLLFVQIGSYHSPSPTDARILSVLRSQFGTDYASRS